jgi:alkaline phosphatase
MKVLSFSSICLQASFLILSITSVEVHAQENKVSRPKNIILMIGDGMGLAHIHAAHLAKNEILHMEQLQEIGMMTTHSYDNGVTDSGAGGTAIATGNKTRNGMIGMTADSLPTQSMLEIFAAIGKTTGIVVSCAVTHATPASFIAKNINRNNFEEIALDFLNAPVDVVIGGGINHFSARKDKRNLEAELLDKGYGVFRNFQETGLSKYFILTDTVHPPSMVQSRGDYLSQATILALKTLSKNDNGFFLMIEGSQIDWAGHDNDSAYLIQEMIDFDNVVGEVLRFAQEDKNTLVIVTADHETGGLTLFGSYKSRSKFIRLKFTSDDHTAVMVPVMAFGPGSEQFKGFFDNTDLFRKVISVSDN